MEAFSKDESVKKCVSARVTCDVCARHLAQIIEDGLEDFGDVLVIELQHRKLRGQLLVHLLRDGGLNRGNENCRGMYVCV